MDADKRGDLLDQADRIIYDVLLEGAKVGKDTSTQSEWETKSARFHAMRAHAHLEHWLWDKKSEGHMAQNQVEDEVHLQHALVRCLMSILKLEDEKTHSD